MSVPFSNTHLRVPAGFGVLLEGLAREVLRDQPEDIPKYAARYFDVLLKQREESGMDPSEWAAVRLEGRLNSNNHALKTNTSDVKESATEVTDPKEKSYESQTEDESSRSVEASDLPITQSNVSAETDLTESTGEEEEDDDEEEKLEIGEMHFVSTEKVLSEEESVNRLPAADTQPDELSGTDEERDPTITASDQVDGPANEKESSSAPHQDTPQYELGISNVDVCAQELEMAEDDRGDNQPTAVVDKEIIDSEEEKKSKDEEPVEVFPYSGLADVDVCAAELVGTEETVKGDSAEGDINATDEESSQPQAEETMVPSQPGTPEPNQEDAEDQAEKTKEKEETETDASSERVHESSTSIEGGLDSKAVSELVEISFDDVPEVQQIKEEQTEQEDSAEISETKMLEMQQEEESKEVSPLSSYGNILGTQDRDEPEMAVNKEVNPRGEEMESQQEASDKTYKTADANELNEGEDDETGEGVKAIGLSHQPTAEADEENPEDETSREYEGKEKISEGEPRQSESNDPDLKEDGAANTAGGNQERIHGEGQGDVADRESDGGDGAENHASQETQSNVSTAALEAESETSEESAQHLQAEEEESQRTLAESQPEDAMEGKEVTLKERASEAEGPAEEAEIDSETQEKSDETREDGLDGPAADRQAEERPVGATQPQGDSGDKQEDCSRPQEEEDIMDIPLDDPEANRAAAKIQAGFRGHMTRKKMKPEDKAEGEEVSSTGDVLNGSQGDTETGGSGAVERDDTSVPEQ